MAALLMEGRHPIRVLLHTPGFTAAAVLSLALGIGANSAAALLPALRQALGGIEPALAAFNSRTLSEHVGRSLAVERLQSVVLATFGVLALVLAAVGIYGVMAYRVSQRTRELGVRIALGAGRRELLWPVLLHGLRLAAAGIGAGLVLAFWLSRGVESRLYGVDGTEPLTFALAPGILLAVAALAALLPARRVTQVDPLAALRCE